MRIFFPSPKKGRGNVSGFVKACCCFVFSFLLTPSFAETSKTDCISHLISLLRTQTEHFPKKRELPPEITLSVNQAEAIHLFRVAKKLWHFRQQDLFEAKPLIEKMTAGNFDVLTEPSKAKLKIIRKDALVLQSAFILFDEEQTVPKYFDRFVTHLGKLNDAIQNDFYEDIKKESRLLLKAMDKMEQEKWNGSFAPIKRSVFEKRMKRLTSFIRKAIQSDYLSAHQFHHLRKKLKLLLFFFLLKQSTGEDSKLKTVCEFFSVLNDEMGEIHDDLVRTAAEGHIEYEKHPVEIPSRGKKLLLELLDRLSLTKL